ncbi:MAG: hypothetical protein GTN73_02875 [Candidatus Aminicenantes bacterium]|nr:hypothetical protein [Candidatus Aminicenantes bacterium]
MKNQKEKGLLILGTVFFCFIWIFMFVAVHLIAEEPHVILYNLTNYRGRQMKITKSAPNLSSSPYKFDNMAASIKLVGVSSVAVYEDGNYRGWCETITRDIPNLAALDIGKNKISSIKLNARCASTGPSVILYERKNYQGNQIRIRGNKWVIDSKLKPSSLKLDGASSVAVYTGERYSGFCETFTKNVENLSKTSIGNNNIKSLKVNGNCGIVGKAVVLYENINYSGKQFIVTGDISNLRQMGFNNKVSSIKLFKVNSVGVFDQPGYRGACETITTNTANLRFASDRVSSILLNFKCGRVITVKNNAGFVIKAYYRISRGSIKTEGLRSDFPRSVEKNLRLGQTAEFSAEGNKPVDLIIEMYTGLPTDDLKKAEIKQICRHHLDMKQDVTIIVTGTVFNPRCELIKN